MRKIIVLATVAAMAFPAIMAAQYTRRACTATATGAPYEGPAATLHGTLKALTKKEITIEVDPDQSLTIRRTRKTQFLKDGQPVKPSDIPLGTAVAVDTKQDPDLKLSALSLTIATAKPAPAPPQ